MNEVLEYVGELEGVDLYYDPYINNRFLFGRKNDNPDIKFIIGGTKEIIDFEIAISHYKQLNVL